MNHTAHESIQMCYMILVKTAIATAHTVSENAVHRWLWHGITFLHSKEKVSGYWISFLKMTSIRSVVTSSRCGDEAFLAKMYPTHICQYPVVFAVKGLINIWKSAYSNQTRWLFSTKWKSVWQSAEYVKLYQLCNTFHLRPNHKTFLTRGQHCIFFVVLFCGYRNRFRFSLSYPCLLWFLAIYTKNKMTTWKSVTWSWSARGFGNSMH